MVPEHDGLEGKNVLKSKGAIHYLRNDELNENRHYLKSKINKEKIVSLIVGGPNKYYDFNNSAIQEIFGKVLKNFISKDYQLIFIQSMRTHKRIIDLYKPTEEAIETLCNLDLLAGVDVEIKGL